MRAICYVLGFLMISSFAKAQNNDPVPPNGMAEFVKYLNTNLVLNKTVIDKDLSGEIEVEFRVNKNGVLDSFNVVKDLGDDVAISLIKVIKQAGDWTAASKQGVMVDSWVTLPYKVLSKYNSSLLSENLVAQPSDGIDAFRVKFLKNFKYPEKAINAGVKGVFVLKFTVKENGKLTNIKLLRNPGYDMEEAAIRALRRAGSWLPTIKNGVPESSDQEFEFTLNLQEFRRHM